MEQECEENVENDLKKIVVNYLEHHNLEEAFDDLLNKILVLRPRDPFRDISRLLLDKSKESKTVLAIEAKEIVGLNGTPSIELELSTINGSFRSHISDVHNNNNYEKDFGRSIIATHVQYFNDGLTNEIIGKCILEQDRIDDYLCNKPDVLAPLVTASSFLCCQAGARANCMCTFEHIALLAGNSNIKLPLPCFEVYTSHIIKDGKDIIISIRLASYAEKKILDAIYIASRVIYNTELGSSNQNCYGNNILFEDVAQIIKAILESLEELQTNVQIELNLKELQKKEHGEEPDLIPDGHGFVKSIQSACKKLNTEFPALSIQNHVGEGNSDENIRAKRSKRSEVMPPVDFVLSLQSGNTVTHFISLVMKAQSDGMQVCVDCTDFQNDDLSDVFTHLAVGLGADYLVLSGHGGSASLKRYNELLRISRSRFFSARKISS